MNFRYLKLFRHRQLVSRFEQNRNVHRSSTLVLNSQCSRTTSSNQKSETRKNSQIKGRKLMLRTPSGTFDRKPQQMALQQNVLRDIIEVFEKHGAETTDTPIFEYKDVLTEKYGEDTKLIFDLEDNSGEKLSLRYDLTVPLARYVAMNQDGNFKRYHIGKVYRKDSPEMNRGRYREFLQCDFDIVGSHDAMIPDAECVKVVAEILDSLNVGDYVIKLNHRGILDGILAACGAPADKFREICSAIDKLDKRSWCQVRQEMIQEKGIDDSVADKIGQYVQLNGGTAFIENLLQDENLQKIPSAVSGLESMKLLLKYLHIFGLENKICVDLSLARGLDYYTGAIFEAVLTDKKNVENLGSVAGGGRYDNLIGMFDKNGKSTPCVGISIGVERILLLIEARNTREGIKHRTNKADVFVVTAHRGLGEERLKLVNKLWDAGIRCENSTKLSPKILMQFLHCEKYNSPIALVLGQDEIDCGVVKLRDMKTRAEEDIPLDELIEEIRKRLVKLQE